MTSYLDYSQGARPFTPSVPRNLGLDDGQISAGSSFWRPCPAGLRVGSGLPRLEPRE